MSVCKARLTVYFEEPFWVGLYEREEPEGYRACKITFGAEPRDQEILAFLLARWRALEFSPALPAVGGQDRCLSPKRAQRQARQATRPAGTGTRAQQAIQLQREQQKAQRKKVTREQRQAEQARRFDLRQQKRREKRRGH